MTATRNNTPLRQRWGVASVVYRALHFALRRGQARLASRAF